ISGAGQGLGLSVNAGQAGAGAARCREIEAVIEADGAAANVAPGRNLRADRGPQAREVMHPLRDSASGLGGMADRPKGPGGAFGDGAAVVVADIQLTMGRGVEKVGRRRVVFDQGNDAVGGASGDRVLVRGVEWAV